MKVMYVISRPNTTVGGHLFSLKTISQAVQARADVSVVSLGVRSAVLTDGGMPYYHIDYRRWAFNSALRKLSKLVAQIQPDVVHSFDARALYFARFAAWWHRKGLVHTKCGGPNPGKYYPRVDNLVLFSEENANCFKGRPRFRSTRMYLIPNRAGEVPQNEEKIKEIRDSVPGSHAIVLRIGRFTREYEATSMQGLNLVKRLRHVGVPVSFVQIGNVQNEPSVEQLKAQLGPTDRLFTEPKFTLNASECIEAGDVVLGTGRGLMEAASRKRALLVPVSGSELPAVISAENWELLAKTNFSGRCAAMNSDQETLETVQHLLISQKHRADMGRFAREMYDKHFSVEAAIDQYMEIYASLDRQRIPALRDLLIGGIRLFQQS